MPRLLIAVITLLALAYGLPLFAPPAAVFPAPAGSDFTLWQRIFPGVPVVWITTRLLCLALALILIAWRLKLPLSLHLATIATPNATPTVVTPLPARGWQWLALGWALTQTIAGPYVAQLGRLGEFVYFVGLGVPAALMMRACRDTDRKRERTRYSHASLLLSAGWGVSILALAWRSPRVASVVDSWINLRALVDVVTGNRAVLAGSWNPGLSNSYMMLEGVSFLGGPGVPTAYVLVWLQIVHTLWASVCGLAIASITRRMAGNAAALVAQVVFLFSPFVLSFPYNPIPIFIGPLCVSTLLLLFFAALDLRSPAALAAFAIVAGFSARVPQITLLTLLLCLILLPSLLRIRPIPWLLLAIATSSGLAVVLLGFPSLETLKTSAYTFTFGHAQMIGLLLSFFGQRTPLAVPEALVAGSPGPWDVPLGALIAPFAIARTPLRLWGDALFEPWGVLLFAIGLLLCLREVRSNAKARLLLALLITGSATAVVSSGDVVSHTRLAPALVPIAILAGVGFEALRRALTPNWPTRWLLTGTIGAVAFSGVWIFEVVTPRITPASWMATSFEALGTGSSATRAGFVDFGEIADWQHVDAIATMLPARPQAALQLCALRRTLSTGTWQTYFWSPAQEQDSEVSCHICAQWPDASLYTLRDRVGLFVAFAASLPGNPWTPHLPAERWSRSNCQPDLAPQASTFCAGWQCPVYETTWLAPAQLQELKCATAMTPAATH